MKKLYICEGCGAQYDHEPRAVECEASDQFDVPRLAVGDIVVGRSGFGWFDGDSEWIANPKTAKELGVVAGEIATNGKLLLMRKKHPPEANCFSECCTLSFFYVVSAIDRENHRVRYHLFTGAMKGGYRSGYTYNRHHVAMEKAAKYPKNLDVKKVQFLGQKARTLV